MSTLPTWSHGGRPALTIIFGRLRDEMQKDGLGFAGSRGAKIGCEWMLKLTQLLYDVSTFHG